MDFDFHMRVVRIAKAAMFTLFAANLVRIVYRTWKYGGSKERREDTFDLAEDPNIEMDDDNIIGVGKV